MRVVEIEVGYDVYLWSIAGHDMNKVSSDLPSDARVLAINPDYNRRVLKLTVESATFADVPQNGVMPLWNPTLTVETTELAMLADLVSKRHDAVEDDCPYCGIPRTAHVCPKCDDCGEHMDYHVCPT